MSGSRGIKPRKQFHKRALTATRAAHDRNRLSCLDGKADIKNGVILSPGVSKPNIMKRDTTIDVTQDTVTRILL